MTILNLRIIQNIPFEDYLRMPGYSYSGMKGFSGTASSRMRLGSAVDCYAFTPHLYVDTGEFDLKMIQTCVVALKSVLGKLWDHLKFQLTVTADFCSHGLIFPYRGRPDCAIPGKIVVDLKITERIAWHLGYQDSISGYALSMSCPLAFIIAIHPKTFAPTVVPIPIRSGWWERKVLEYGRPFRDPRDNPLTDDDQWIHDTDMEAR